MHMQCLSSEYDIGIRLHGYEKGGKVEFDSHFQTDPQAAPLDERVPLLLLK